MNTAILDIRSKHGLLIKADIEKNFSVVLSGFDNLDTAYTLTLTKGAVEKVFAVGTEILLDTDAKTLTLVFVGAEFTLGTWTGTLESDNKNADTFYRNEIKLILE